MEKVSTAVAIRTPSGTPRRKLSALNKECNMRKNRLMPGSVVPCLPVRRLSVTWLLLAAVLTGCSAPMAVTPRIPPPALDLMEPTPTGSEVLQRATQIIQHWHQTLLSGQTE